ncbi:uncharacterized protein LOC108601294 [Drosophila busckii]|uniref:uncharacterized protein LOC108601294 n=1 Tax=Drosophila busckii TaxID=30019 RepID=UPI00083ED823|nr:uncharacterized protein LOC108601294 [Drosophila busckii]
MSDKKICGYRPAPENYNNWLTALHAERLKRLGQRNSAKSLGSQQRPMIIVLHLFADDIEGLQHWLDIIYELAAPTAYGECIDFVVDDLWGAYVFQLDGFSICRGDSSFDITSPPLIYGVSTAGEVHFFGNAAGPRIPSVESLGEFCGQLWQQKLVQEFGLESRLQVQPIHLADFNKYIYDEEQGDVLLCLYGSHTTHKFLQDLEILAAKLQHEQIKLYKMDPNMLRTN